MREMKNSGTEWLSDIPHDWTLSNIGSLYTMRNVKVSDRDYPPLSVTMKGVVPQLETAAKTDAHDDRKLVRKGDFAINSRSDRRGSCGIADRDGSVSLINTILAPRTKMNPDYYNWLFHSTSFADEFYRWGHGIVDDLWTTRWQEMKKIDVPVPSYEEQAQIASTLETECTKVDALIANQEAQIEKLKAYKQSIITEAVTKGFDPNVQMKDSGVDEIGCIPENYDIRKTLLCLDMPITDGPHTTPELFDEGIPFVSAEAVSCGNGGIDFSHIRGYISQEFYEECCKKYIPQIDDIYMIKSGATTGRVSIVSTDEVFTIWSPLAVFRCNSEVVVPKYLFYYLQSKCYQQQVELGWSYGTQQNIGMRTLEKLKVVVPPLDIQNRIIEYLDHQFEKTNELISIKQLKIEKLNQYKKSLIYEYVTGKKEVSC